MGLRLYLRGLGIGIVVTALLMGYTLGGKKELSDAEIISRAESLGMVEESKVLVQPQEKEEQDDVAADPGSAGTDTPEKDESSPIIVTGEGDLPKEPENEVTDAAKDETDKTGSDKEAGNEPEKETQEPETSREGVNGESTKELSVSGAVKGAEEPGETETSKTKSDTDNKAEADTGTKTETETGTKTGTESGTGSDTGTKTGTETSGTKSDTDNKAEADTGTKTGTGTGTDSDTGTKTGTGTGTGSDTGTKSKVITVTIKKGSDSLAAAKELERAGIIENAAAFDGYLVSKKLDRLISSGSFKIPDGASDQEIARIITGR